MYFFLLPLFFMIVNVFQCQGVTLKTSVIVPCFYGHFKYLEGLMDALGKQTVLPDEVVVSLSEVDKVDPLLLKNFQEQVYPFQLKLVTHKEQRWAGTNRNNACENASGDIFICQDADDVPHPQRIEIIKYFFENFEINHLIHFFSCENIEKKYDKNDVPWFFLKDWDSIKAYNWRIHYGQVAIKKEVFNKIKWKDWRSAEDVQFDWQSFETLGKMAIVEAKLLLYRQCLSSYNVYPYAR